MSNKREEITRKEFEESLEPHLKAPKMKVVFGELFEVALKAKEKEIIEKVMRMKNPNRFGTIGAAEFEIGRHEILKKLTHGKKTK